MTEQEKARHDMKLEVVLLVVSDVDRAKAFYENLGWRLDIDIAPSENYRAIQFTPPGSQTSIIFGKGVTSAESGPADGLVLAVNDVAATREDLLARGVGVSEVFHYAGGPFNNTLENPRAGGRGPPGPPLFFFASFRHPRARPRGPLLLLVRIVQRPGRQRLAVAGDYDALTRSRGYGRDFVRLRDRPRGRGPARRGRRRRAPE